MAPFEDLSTLLLIGGAVLVVLEAFAPGAHFIVLGVALLVAGLIGLALPPSVGIFTPIVLAALVLVVGGAALYVYRQFDFYGGKGSGRTSDSDSLRGKVGRVTEPVSTQGGEVKIEEGGFNPYYRARSVDGEIPVGTEVMIVDPGGGNVVTVEAIDDYEDDIDRELARDRDSDTERDADAA
jgi:membrane protein implicated in regulation of membrane protease activity